MAIIQPRYVHAVKTADSWKDINTVFIHLQDMTRENHPNDLVVFVSHSITFSRTDKYIVSIVFSLVDLTP